MVGGLGDQRQNVDFAETCFTGRTDSTVIRYSVTNNGLPSNNRFRFKGTVVKASRI
jgi:hypothetical protein